VVLQRWLYLRYHCHLALIQRLWVCRQKTQAIHQGWFSWHIPDKCWWPYNRYTTIQVARLVNGSLPVSCSFSFGCTYLQRFPRRQTLRRKSRHTRSPEKSLLLSPLGLSDPFSDFIVYSWTWYLVSQTATKNVRYNKHANVMKSQITDMYYRD
jgi:hypothetical protein